MPAYKKFPEVKFTREELDNIRYSHKEMMLDYQGLGDPNFDISYDGLCDYLFDTSTDVEKFTTVYEARKDAVSVLSNGVKERMELYKLKISSLK